MDKVSSAEFEEVVLGSPVPVLVDFFQLHCLPCKRIVPVLEEVAQEIGDRGRVVSVQFEDSPELVMAYDVVSFPTMILFEGGELKKRLIGPKPKDMLVALFDEKTEQRRQTIEERFAL